MVDTNHRDMTGAALHEPKGAASANAGEVYVADGAASGAWTDISTSVAIYQYQETDGVDGDNYTASWAAVDLNTEVSDVNNIGVLASRAITLGAGTYMFTGWVGMDVGSADSGWARCRIRNTSDGSTAALGTNVRVNNPSGGRTTTLCHVHGLEVISGSKVFELQIIGDNGTTIQTGYEDEMTNGVEVYASLTIWKIA